MLLTKSTPYPVAGATTVNTLKVAHVANLTAYRRKILSTKPIANIGFTTDYRQCVINTALMIF